MEDVTPQGLTRSGEGVSNPRGFHPIQRGRTLAPKNRIFKNQRGKSTFVGYLTKVGAGKTARFLISREIKIINEIK